MNDEAAIAWLRKQIEGDLSAARIISDGGIVPQKWTTDPPGQVNPEVHPASGAITALLGDDHGHWTAVIAWDHEIGDGDDEDGQVSYLPSMLVDNGRREVDHICRHDPRNVAADCEAKLALLSLHAVDRTEGWDDECRQCCASDGCGGIVTGANWPCGTLSLLASAYRHRDGYSEHWES